MAIERRSQDAQALLEAYDQLLSRLPNDFNAVELARIEDSRARLARFVFETAKRDFEQLEIP